MKTRHTAIATFKAMLDASGVTYTTDTTADGERIEVAAMHGPHNTGVGGLYTLFQFGAKGQLLDVSVLERRSSGRAA